MNNLGGMWIGDPVAARNGDGRLEVFAVGTDHRLYRRHQVRTGGEWADRWFAFPDSYAAGFHWEPVLFDPGARPSVINNLGPDGRLWLFARSVRGRLYNIRQDSGSSTGWTGWEDLGGIADNQPVVGDPVVSYDAFERGLDRFDRRLKVFARGRNGDIHQRRQESPGSTAWTPWVSMGGVVPGVPAVVHNPTRCCIPRPGTTVAFYNGPRHFVLARGMDSNLWINRQATPNPTQSPNDVLDRYDGWTRLGGVFTGDPVLAAWQLTLHTTDSRIGVFVRGMDGALWLKRQSTIEGGFEASWRRLGGTLAGRFEVGFFPNITLTQVLFRRPDNTLRRVFHERPASDFTFREDPSPLADRVVGDPAIIERHEGALMDVFFRRTDHSICQMRQESPGSRWV